MRDELRATLGRAGAGTWNQVINGGRYYLQQEWSDAAGSCQSRAKGDSISFSAPAPRAASHISVLGARDRKEGRSGHSTGSSVITERLIAAACSHLQAPGSLSSGPEETDSLGQLGVLRPEVDREPSARSQHRPRAGAR